MFKRANGNNQQLVRLTVSGQTVYAAADETVASVLLKLEPPHSRTNPVSGQKRAPYCLMGVCFDCLVHVDGGAPVQACLVKVRDGMEVERSTSMPEVS